MNARHRCARIVGSLMLLAAAPAAWAAIVQAGKSTSLATWVREAWPTFAHSSHHDGRSAFAAQSLTRVRWSTPVDLAPPGGGGALYIHYGSPLVTPGDTVIVPVKTTSGGDFVVEGHRGHDGALLWKIPTDYILPSAGWIPLCGPTLTPGFDLVIPAIGGTVLRVSDVDATPHAFVRQAFYGLANYFAKPGDYDSNVQINTPIVSDDAGNVYFGFIVLGSTPIGLQSGIARIGADGAGSWVPAGTAAGDPYVAQIVDNCAPALSQDGTILYAGFRDGGGGGYLVGLDAATLSLVWRVRLKDPMSGGDALLFDLGTASPCVGPDGDVYFGVLENPFGANHVRGWMLHYDATLAVTKMPGDFGWDNTASIVPAAAVPLYTGSSNYLLVTKYNNYAVGGGDGINKIAVLDPNASQVDPQTGATVMKEVITMPGPTPDPGGGPLAVKEWCINNIAVDPRTKSAMANSEDGTLYRWDFTTNTLSQKVVLTSGIGEAYTPTVIGVDGTVYAINDAILFAVGR